MIEQRECWTCHRAFIPRKREQHYCNAKCGGRAATAKVAHERRERNMERLGTVLAGNPVAVTAGPGKRHDDCAEYARCLTYASAMEWHGFHCGACGKYKPVTLDEKRGWVTMYFTASALRVRRMAGMQAGTRNGDFYD